MRRKPRQKTEDHYMIKCPKCGYWHKFLVITTISVKDYTLVPHTEIRENPLWSRENAE